MRKLVSFFLSPYKPLLICLGMIIVGIALNFFPFENITISFSIVIGFTLAIYSIIPHNSIQISNYPFLPAKFVAYSLPISRKNVVLGWYLSLIVLILIAVIPLTTGLVVSAFILGSWTPNTLYICSLFLNLAMTSIIMVNLIMPTILIEKEHNHHEKISLVGQILLNWFIITYNILFYVFSKDNPNTTILFIIVSLLLLIITTFLCVYRLNRKADIIEIY